MRNVALIVGAGPGLGVSLARTFTQDGYDVAFASRRSGSTPELPAATPAQTRTQCFTPMKLPALSLSCPDSTKAPGPVKSSYGPMSKPSEQSLNARELKDLPRCIKRPGMDQPCS